jgi:hypothetical protein
MKVIKAVALYSVMFILMFGAWQTLSAQTSDISGKWKATWLSGGTPNTITLTEKNGTVYGTFTAERYTARPGVEDACPLTGTHVGGRISLHATCPNWDISLDGTLTDDSTIEGGYVAYGNSVGKFRMEKVTCWLPEGCK